MFSILPPERISNHIFPFLHVNDLLRLRRVCKVAKYLADDYLRVYGTSERVVFIDLGEGSNDLTTFLALTYPLDLTRFDFWNKGNSSWTSGAMQTFLRLYGEKITHLEIHSLAILIESPATVQFFEGLSNLKELRIHHVKETGYDNNDEEQVAEDEAPLPDLNLPSTFKRLKHLHVGRYTNRPQLFFKFMEECSTNLERFNYPLPYNSSRFRAPDDVFEWVRRIVDTRHRENPDKPNLKYLDLKLGYYIKPGDVRSFYRLVTTCSAHVKLQNVDARMIEAMMQLDTPDKMIHGDKISRCVVSIRNLTKSVFRLELPVLEKIHFERTSECYMAEGDFQRQPWSNLKELKLWVDSEWLDVNDDGERGNVSRLLEFFFNGIRRENLESLELTLPYPDITSVCSSCPNLKKLRIYDWPGSSRDIAQLWGSLPLLEDVTFWSCATLGDAAFIGDDFTRPAIWKAARLKSLGFKNLKKMPGITDVLFTVALRHMPLKALYLGSTWEPVSSITLAGLESLLTGKFAETVEKFPLKRGIQLEGVTGEQLAELERQFRSAQIWAGSR